jgi:hypothetical protein
MAEEIITARLVVDTSAIGKLGSGINIGSSGSGSGSSSALGALGGKSTAKAIGTIAAGVGTAVIALSAMKKGFDAVLMASPRLQKSVSILGKSFELLLRPIGDILNLFVRPLALTVMKFAIWFYREWNKFFGKDENQDTLKSVLGINTAQGFIDFNKKLGEGITSMFEGFEDFKFVEKIKSLFSGAEGGFNVTEWFQSFFTTPDGNFSIIQFFKSFFNLALISNPFSPIKWFKEFFLTPGGKFDIIGWFKSFFGSSKDKESSNVIANSIKAGSGSSKYLSIPTASESLSNILSRVTGTSQRVTNVKDALITKSGQVVKFDPNDNIMATKGSGGMGSNININISVNALDSSSINSSVLNKISQAVSEEIRRNMSRRTTEFIGGF